MKGKWDGLLEDRRHELFGLVDDDHVLMKSSFAKILMDMVINENVVKKSVARRTETATLMDRDAFIAHFRYVRGWTQSCIVEANCSHASLIPNGGEQDG